MGDERSGGERRRALAAWAIDHGFELQDDRDQEAERLPLVVIQAAIDRDVHNVCVGLWEDTDVVLFDLRRGRGPDRVDSTGAAIAYPYGLPTILIGHRDVPEEPVSLSAIPEVAEHPLGRAYSVRCRDRAFATALLVDPLATWLIASADRQPPLSFELNLSWLLGHSGVLETDQLADLLERVLRFRDRIPDDVLTGFGG